MSPEVAAAIAVYIGATIAYLWFVGRPRHATGRRFSEIGWVMRWAPGRWRWYPRHCTDCDRWNLNGPKVRLPLCRACYADRAVPWPEGADGRFEVWADALNPTVLWVIEPRRILAPGPRVDALTRWLWRTDDAELPWPPVSGSRCKLPDSSSTNAGE